MCESAALLVEHRLPAVPWRQWVLSFEGPMAMRLGYDKRLLGRVCQEWAASVTVDPANGTRVTISNLVHALEAYGRTFPGAPPVRIGDISARCGGTLRQHKSHQSGRDVDLRFVLLPAEADVDEDTPHRQGEHRR